MRRRKCSSKCQLFGRCFYIKLSERFDGKCALANLDEISLRNKHKYINLLTGDQDTYADIMRDLLAEMDLKIRSEKNAEKNLNNMMRYFDKITTFFQTMFGTKYKIDQKTEVRGGIAIADLKAAYITVTKRIQEEEKVKAKKATKRQGPKVR